MAKKKILEARNLSKRFPGVQALKNVNFELFEGEVLGICGENGAGKSTLIKCLSGVHQPDEGTILFMGKEVLISNEQTALNLGISVIYQELSLVSMLDIAQNIYLGRLPHNKMGDINFNKLYCDSKEILDKLGLHYDPMTTRVDSLNISAQQLVECGKAISRNPKVLILDEPTSSLGQDDIKRLFGLIKKFKEQGYGIIYISHHMLEIFDITDRVLVLRDGESVECRNIVDWDVDSIVFAMVNRKVDSQFPQKHFESIKEPVLEVEGLTNKYIHDISFTLRKGEILGLAGIVGAGRSEVLKTLYGVYPVQKGIIKINGKEVKIKNPSQALAEGMSFMSEDSKNDMLNMESNIQENIVLPYLKKISRFSIVSTHKKRVIAEEAVHRYDIKTDSIERRVIQLSGGNQQKVVLARITYGQPVIFLLDEPTRGIDVGVKQDIYNEIINFSKNGSAVLLVTSELEEIVGLADRVLVMRDRTIVAELQKDEINQNAITYHATGGSLV
jgi:ribose transport system ATP-binding protein